MIEGSVMLGSTILEAEAGEEWIPQEMAISPSRIERWGDAADDHHPWYTEDSPWGGRIAHPTIIYMLHAYARGKAYPEGAGPGNAILHYVYDAEYHNVLRAGEKVTIKGRCAARYLKRDRDYVDLETESYGEDGRLIARSVMTFLLSYRRKENQP
ncbi:MAG: MaoC family dehydratase N-terminal domain-containing protein [Chloroflexi bacterium]|nr:MaoC family dehydratase N-terminal domain-containing protein [Chloroflexota bacterium]